ncbi:YjbF family lipoprotein [Vibrio ostreicida]|uniref:YjbF family lipoprotein n=1 Tax=Vibrio ostreicida TaxID=526588 RepID=A0ABT8BPR2_9VIBR|nr:YjbF family lipoprotein [Vibrio ostreicida]MDN3608434.1 YjbF family lipoprotein [Vibrio ostreicida]MDN3611088.1 YjbF family lipoprotein [Vibrio ostreicida]NPD10255.1 YjbF family lipoprotein [Vibrio ostreicida]
MPNRVRFSLLATFFVLLFGCTQRFSDTNDTLKEALFGFDNISLDKQAISQLPYASSYFKINDGPQIFMVLAFVEKQPISGNLQLKWISNDSAMIVTENGRVVKTYNLPGSNLSGVLASKEIPHFQKKQYQWQATYDWQPNYQFNHLARIDTTKVATLQLESAIWSQQTHMWQEYLSFDGLDKTMHSTYWTDLDGNVVKSAQWVIPDQLFIEQEILKPFKG